MAGTASETSATDVHGRAHFEKMVWCVLGGHLLRVEQSDSKKAKGETRWSESVSAVKFSCARSGLAWLAPVAPPCSSTSTYIVKHLGALDARSNPLGVADVALGPHGVQEE